ncbi:pilus assembly protein [Oricola cellulosilytica]|uniref:Pilus assembly protein n=2 Tax=Oricola cellulosilytica TaxID=1429082 RepID=A0A4R0PJ51_9HYPH|nr:pilus assembly protein [Oricola cellulosilytica]
MVLSISAIFEFGYAMFQWNATAKALQFGARWAAVSDPLAPSFDDSAIPSDPLLVPGPITPAQAPDVTCSGAPLAGEEMCNSGLNRIVYGSKSATTCVPNTRGICNLNSRITPANIVVTYSTTGLGYWGRPEGRVVTITVAARSITFNLPLLGALLGVNSMAIPALPVTITSEDMDCGTC